MDQNNALQMAPDNQGRRHAQPPADGISPVALQPQGKSDSGQNKRKEQEEQLTRASDLLPSVSAPKGGGAIRGLDEKLSVDAATGTCATSVRIPFSPGRSGLTPSLSLSYDSGSGNGPLGFGWNLGLPEIRRKTDKGLPRYCHGDESDVFVLTGADDLVPVLNPDGSRKTLPRVVSGASFEIEFYRPRIEGLFSRIEWWTETATGQSHWRTISRDNVTTLYGTDPTSQVADPADPARVYSWHICQSWDDKGNAASYTYTAEDSADVDLAAASEANRTAQTRAAQIYLTAIRYGNVQPYFPSLPDFSAFPTDWMFLVVLDYGDHTSSPPTPVADRPWQPRPDPFSSYRPGFEVRSYRRVQRFLFFNNFPDEPTAGADCLVRSLDLTYSDQQAPTDPRNPSYTFLVSVTETAYRQDASGLTVSSMPPLEYDYNQPLIGQQVLTLDPDSQAGLPEGLDGSRFRWTDLDGEGLPGILTDSAGSWYYKRNRSAANLVWLPDGTAAARARFGPLETVACLPSRGDLSNVRLMDLAASGRLDVVSLSEPDAGFFERTADAGFEPMRRFVALPALDWSDPNVRFIDVTGDGLADILITEDRLYTVYAGLGETGFSAAQQVRIPWDEERGPAVILADGTETIFTADMSGDGLTDIVRVRNGEVCYWPNIGYGRFGTKVAMDAAPRFGGEELFDPRRVRLADVDGTGTADLLYVGADGVTVWFNQSGNAWSAPTVVAVYPTADQASTVEVLDFLGTGTACLVWSSPLPAQSAVPLRYVDLMSGRKPHLLIRARNNLGEETRVSYAPSTRFYVADEQAGRPWVTRLAFPVQVVERAETIDWIGRNRLVTRYAYHHGYFDAYEREFRGFGLVEQWDTEEFRSDTEFDDGDFVNWDQQSWSPPVLTKTWFHTGAFEEARSVSQQYLSEYWTEPALRAPGQETTAAAMRLPDTVLPGGLDAFEVQEAYRALKGHPVRIETYAADGSAAAANPYTVTEQNFTVCLVQHRGQNLHGVFFVHPREALTFHYERGAADPRVVHEMTLQADPYGNVLRSVSIGYPRRLGYPAPEPALPGAAQGMLAYDQARLHIRGTENGYTNAIDDLATWPDAYRVPLVASIDSAEITGFAPAVRAAGITDLFTFEDMDGPGGVWPTVWQPGCDIPYEQIPASDVDGTGAPASGPTRRFVARRRVRYRADDLSAVQGPGVLQPCGLPGESYQAALTDGMVSAIFGSLVPATTLTGGGYVSLAGETGWWIPSGQVYYSPGDTDAPPVELSNALRFFFLPFRAVDPFGAVTRAGWDRHALLPVSATDAVLNMTAAANDYRVLAPATITDPNGNRAALAFDVFGRVTATALMGKVSETLGDELSGFTADPDEATLIAAFTSPTVAPAAVLGNATTRVLYDTGAYQRTSGAAQPSPPAVYTLAREIHVSDLAAPPPYPGAPTVTGYQYHFAYGDGFGREIQRKTRAAPDLVTGAARWATSGWTIFDNKGRPVRVYEPFYSATNGFEFAVQTGVSTVTIYDPPGRTIAALHPDNTWEKTAFGPWRSQKWDGDDTVLVSDPRTDPDIGGYFTRLLGTAPFTSWYDLRIGGSYGSTAEERAWQQDAATKTAPFAATPATTHLDSAGRACLAVADNGPSGRYPVRTAYDTEGKPLAVFDELGRRAEEHCYRASPPVGYVAGTDMAGIPVYHVSADGGARRTLANVAGQLIGLWDDRGHAFQLIYDLAQRLTHRYLSTGDASAILLGLNVYGEGQPAANLGGRLFRGYDQAGYLENSEYDFKGNLRAAVLQLAADYHQSVDWTPLAALTSAAALDAAATAAGLVPSGDGGRDRFTSGTIFDALNRPIQQVAPHNPAMQPDVIQPSYDEAGLLRQVEVWPQQAAAPGQLLDPATAGLHAVTAIAYNARGQQVTIGYGNGTDTTYDYDEQTFRLTDLTTTRPASIPATQRTAQALSYFYDPAGNVTSIRDDAQDVIFFANQKVEPSASYTYDAIYRLISATGREHLGQVNQVLLPPKQVTNDDSFRTGLPQPGDGFAMGTYTETYQYDAAGNLTSMGHVVSSGNWTRRYAYSEPSRITTTETGNRLTTTSLPGDPVSGPFTGTYTHDPHGNMTSMPHLSAMAWDDDDRLRSTTPNVGGSPQVTYYAYDASGQRVRKATDQPGAAVTKAERIYLGAIEVYREFDTDGMTITLSRETLHVADGKQAVALVENRTLGTDKGSAELVRYQHANHLGSAVLELDDASNIITYEEYFPYGSTSYLAVSSQTETPKRYRYTGRERDEENGFNYHGARYYAPWIARWTSPDPAGLADGTNSYQYSRQSPVAKSDTTGLQTKTNLGHFVATGRYGWLHSLPDHTREHIIPGSVLGYKFKQSYGSAAAEKAVPAAYRHAWTALWPNTMAKPKTSLDLSWIAEVRAELKAGEEIDLTSAYLRAIKNSRAGGSLSEADLQVAHDTSVKEVAAFVEREPGVVKLRQERAANPSPPSGSASGPAPVEVTKFPRKSTPTAAAPAEREPMARTGVGEYEPGLGGGTPGMGPHPATTAAEGISWMIIEAGTRAISEENKEELAAALTARGVTQYLESHPGQGALVIVTFATSTAGDPNVGGMQSYYQGMVFYYGNSPQEALRNRWQKIQEEGSELRSGGKVDFLTEEAWGWIPPRNNR
jgi:RHS repeat-associated protein